MTFQSMQSNLNKPPLLERTWLILLAILIFWPLGIYLVWKRSRWPLIARLFITALLIGYLAAVGISMIGFGG